MKSVTVGSKLKKELKNKKGTKTTSIFECRFLVKSKVKH